MADKVLHDGVEASEDAINADIVASLAEETRGRMQVCMSADR
jgi:hypothetical protein